MRGGECSVSDDLLSTQAIKDPEAYFGQLRVEDPVHWNERQKVWVITKHEDVVSICRQPHLFSSDKLGFNVAQIPPEDRDTYKNRFHPIFAAYPHILSAADNPIHNEMRLIINQVWTPLQVEKKRNAIRNFANELLGSLQHKSDIDFLQDFALPFPIQVILEFLGFPKEDWQEVKRYSDKWLAFHFSSGADVARWEIGVEGIQNLANYVRPRIRYLKDQPGDDYISALLKAEWKGGHLTEDQITVHCATMLFAGHETTTNLLANGLYLLLSNRSEWDRICEDPKLLPTAVEEVIRMEGSIKCMTRYALEDVELRGKKIRKGELILLVNTAANSDPDKFKEPKLLNVSRRPNSHVGFGQGIHICLGAPLARIEAFETYLALSQRFPSIRLKTHEVEYQSILRARALKKLPILLH